MGVLAVPSLTGCLGSDTGNNNEDQTETDEPDLLVRYNVEIINDAYAPGSSETYSEGPHAVFTIWIENKMSDLLPLGDQEEQLDPPFEPPSQGAQVWSVFENIPADEEEKGNYVWVADSMDADPTLVAASDEYEVVVNRDEEIDVETQIFKG